MIYPFAMHAASNQASEAQRFERLRAQDGKPLLPPPNMQPLCAQGGLDPNKLQEAHGLWQSALGEIQSMPSFPAEERLFWTAFLLSRYHAEHGERPQAQQLLQSTLPHLRDPRHREIITGMLARGAAVLGDHATADQLMGYLDPQSEDLQVDTNFRFTVAYVALARDDAEGALQVLGWQIDDIPISDAYDTVCGVFRAHAHERLGRLDLAQQQLARLASTPAALDTLQEIVQANPALRLCPSSLPAVRQRMQQLHSNVVVTRSGISVGPLVTIPIVGSLVAIGGGQALGSMLGPPLSNIVPGILITVFVVGTIGLVMRTVMRGPAQRRKLAQTGVAGTGQLLLVQQTGTRVNDQPMIKMRMLVQLPGRDPYTAEHNEIVPMIRLSQLQPGSHLQVRVDPNDPTIMAIAWQ